jgi:hypothetical protein
MAINTQTHDGMPPTSSDNTRSDRMPRRRLPTGSGRCRLRAAYLFLYTRRCHPMSLQAPTKVAAVREARTGAEDVAASRGFEWLARSGFVARGVIYGLIGVLAVEVAVGVGGKTTNQQGALETIARQPSGVVLLGLVAAGLAGYSLWRFVHALLGHGPERTDGTFDRVAAFASGLVYAGLCAVAVSIMLGSGGASQNTSKTTGGVLGWPAGTWLVGIAGAVLIGVALYQGYRGVSRDFLEDSKTEQMSPRVRAWVEWIGCFGHIARGVVFALVGIFLIKAAVEFDPTKAIGLDGALAKLAGESYGPFLLGLVSTGLVAFGLYSFSDARYRRI